MTNRILLYATLNWPSAARYAAGFVAAGCEVHAACPPEAPARLSRYVTATYDYRPLFPETSLKAAIQECGPDLIVPCDDRAVAHVLALYRKEKKTRGWIATLIERSLGRPENYAQVISRDGSLAALRARGVRIPETVPLASEGDIDAALAKIGLPAVLKSDGSWGGDGVIIARARAAAVSAYRKLSQAPSRTRSLARAWLRGDAHFLLDAIDPRPTPVSIQRFIPGRPAASAFTAQRGRVLAQFHYDVLVADETIGPPNVVRRVDDPDMDRVVKTVAETFGLTGMLGLDYIRDENGAVHLIEVNPRPTQGGTLPFGDGRDLPAALAQTLSVVPVGRRSAIQNDIVVFFPREMRRDPQSPYLRDGHHDIPHDDPEVLKVLQGTSAPERRSPGMLRDLAFRLKHAVRHA